MEETEKFFEPAPVDSDATLATPRFDEGEAQVARPVVPLSGNSMASRRPRRQWPIALVLVSALAGGVVSLLAFRLYQQRQQSQITTAEVGAQQQPLTNDAAMPEAATSAPGATTEEQAQTEAPLVFEEFDPAKERGVSDASPARTRAEDEGATPRARKDEAKDEATPVPRLVETLRSRRVEDSPAPRQVEARQDDMPRRQERDEDDDRDERRERRRERREQRREQRREPQRNIDRIKDIFEGAPPA